MNPYATYPHIWAPPNYPTLFVVKVPQDCQSLDEKTYTNLMLDRFDWLIQNWLETFTLASTHTMLINRLSELHPFQEHPRLDCDPETFTDWVWRKEWAQAFILHNSTFSEVLWLRGMEEASFPVLPLLPSHSQFETFQENHQDTHLEAWLTELIGLRYH